MARQDMDIKGDVIAELEDIIDPKSGANLLDALMIEELTVNKGQVELLMVYDDRPDSERESLQGDIEEAIEEIEGVQGVGFSVLNNAEIPYTTQDETPQAPAALAPEPAAAPAATAGGFLTLGQLIEGSEDEIEAAAQEEGDDGGKLELYSGGGCAAGTSTAASIAVSTPKAAPAPAPTLNLAAAPKPAAPTTAGSASNDKIWIDRDQWESTIVEKRALEVQVQALEMRLQALQGALRSLIEG